MTKPPRSALANSIRREDYTGRGQTYVKHLFLREYLLALAFKILQSPYIKPDFLYVDGFSGPWRSEATSHTDTSFNVALSVLTDVAQQLRAGGKTLRMRAVFVEKNPESFAAMAQAVKRFDAVGTIVIFGEFEDAIDEIVRLVDGAFVFSFVDPTGWTGLALDRIAPLLRLRGEVLINFMTNSVNRHLGLESVRGGFNQYFGGVGWEREYLDALKAHQTREEAVRLTYLSRLKSICRYDYVGTTRVRFQDRQRTYFHLAYGTRHPAGMEVFRTVEKKAVVAQEELAYESIVGKATKGSGINDMFAGIEDPNLGVFKQWERESQAKAEREFQDWLRNGEPMEESRRLALLMQHPHVNAALVRKMVAQAERDGVLVKRGGERRVMLCPRQWLDASGG